MANFGRVNHPLFGNNDCSFESILRNSANLVLRGEEESLLQFTIPKGTRKSNVELSESQVDTLISFLQGAKTNASEIREKVKAKAAVDAAVKALGQ